MVKHFSFWGSIVLGGILFYLFLLWQFPYGEIKRTIIQTVGDSSPLTLAIDRVGPYFPVGLRIEKISVSGGDLALRVPDLILEPRVFSFLLGKTDLRLEEAKPSPRVQGSFRQEGDGNRLILRLNQAELQASSPKDFSFGIKLSGEMDFRWDGEKWETGNGQVWALLERSEIRGTQAGQAPFPLALFETIKFEAQLKDRAVRVKRLEATGKSVRFTLPKEVQFSLAGGAPPDWGSLFQMPLQPGTLIR